MKKLFYTILFALGALGNIVAETIELVPTFNSCSYYLGSAERAKGEKLRVEFRQQGATKWEMALPPVFQAKYKRLTGSVVNLSEATDYELRLLDGSGRVLASGGFRTFSDVVPIARTIDLSTVKGPLKITDRGRPDGWIKYTAPAGFTVNGDLNPGTDGIEIDHAEYVILDGIRLRGGRVHGIGIRNSRHIRVLNCDIAGWGREGKRGRDPNMFYDEKKSLVHGDCGVNIRNSVGTVVERCFIHDPRSNSSSWQYGHPVGAYAIRVGGLRQTVVRFNDCIGTDERRWCDVIGSEGNFNTEGGFYRDADINGNYMAFPHDDGIELDGGQMNIRLYENRIEGGFCSISTTPCELGPAYVFRNLLTGYGDGDGSFGTSLKDLKSAGGAVFYFNNTIFRDGSGVRVQTDRRDLFNNLICCSENPCSVVSAERNGNLGGVRNNLFYSWRQEPVSVVEGNLNTRPVFVDASRGMLALKKDFPAAWQGQVIPNFTGPKAFIGALSPDGNDMSPIRPTAFVADCYTVKFPPAAAELKQAAPAAVKIRVVKAGFSGVLEVRQNDSFTWFEVTPRRVEVKTGDEVTFQVALKTGNLSRSGLHSGAFLIRQSDGLSLPVSVYAIKPGATPLIQYPAEAVMIQAGDKPGAARTLAARESATFSFNIARDGDYFILFKYFAPHPSYKHDDLAFRLDKGERRKIRRHMTTDKWSWAGLGNNTSKSWTGSTTGLFRLKAGAHTLTLEGVDPIRIAEILVTPTFEFMPGNVNTFSYGSFAGQ